MTLVHEPSLQRLQLSAHLPADLGPLFGNRTLVLGVPAVRGPSRCKPRKALSRPWTRTSTTMELAFTVMLGPRTLT